MPVLMVMDWDGIGIPEYEALRQKVGWERDVPPGASFHVAVKTATGMRAVDLWDSADQLQAFETDRLIPAAVELGIPGQPRVELQPVHNLFTPGYRPVD